LIASGIGIEISARTFQGRTFAPTTTNRLTPFVPCEIGSALIAPEIQMPGGKALFERYQAFRAQLRVQAKTVQLDARELTFGDYTKLVVGWLKKNPW
jgi:hypothetical protein